MFLEDLAAHTLTQCSQTPDYMKRWVSIDGQSCYIYRWAAKYTAARSTHTFWIQTRNEHKDKTYKCTYKKSLLIRFGLVSSTSLKIAFAWGKKWGKKLFCRCCNMLVYAGPGPLPFPVFMIRHKGNLISDICLLFVFTDKSIHSVSDDDVFASPLNNWAANQDIVIHTFSWQTEEAQRDHNTK